MIVFWLLSWWWSKTRCFPCRTRPSSAARGIEPSSAVKGLLDNWHRDSQTAFHSRLSFTKCPCSDARSVLSGEAQHGDDPEKMILIILCSKNFLLQIRGNRVVTSKTFTKPNFGAGMRTELWESVAAWHSKQYMLFQFPLIRQSMSLWLLWERFKRCMFSVRGIRRHAWEKSHCLAWLAWMLS